jgi:peptide chain release factor subunit 1
MSPEQKKKSADLRLYHLKRVLEELRGKKGFHTELISLYIPHDRKLSDVTNYLKNEISESQNIKSKLTRKNVLDGISTLIGMLKNITEVPDNGLVLFAGAIPQSNTPGTERMEKYILEPPEPIVTFRYHCASEFLLFPLEEMIVQKHAYGLLVIGRQESAVGYIKGTRLELIREYTSGIHGKFRAGGQSQRRFERLIEEGEKQFYRRIAVDVNEIFLSMEDFQGIFVGGPGFSKDKFVSDDALDYRLRDKIIAVVDLAYGGAEGLRALVDKVKDKMEDVKYIKEKQVMQDFMKKLTNDSGLAIYGILEVQKALQMGAIDTLILSEKLDMYKVIIECQNCQYSEVRNAKAQEIKGIEDSIQNVSCPKCNSNSFSVSDKIPFIEELGEIAETMGTDVHIISSETEEGESLYRTFGGIVATLRFKLNY